MFLWPFVLFNSVASFTGETGFRVNGLDIMAFCFPIGTIQTLATLVSFLPFFSDFLGF